jgi:hypothetical protein
MGENGMLKTGSYIFDTNRDLTNNLLGTLLALAVMAIHRAAQHSPSHGIGELDAEHALD